MTISPEDRVTGFIAADPDSVYSVSDLQLPQAKARAGVSD
jgi:hypothetical protein